MVHSLIADYQRYRKFFVRYQFIATVLVSLPLFLSLFILGLGIPHLFFLILNALIQHSPASFAKRILHGVEFIYYGILLLFALQFYPELIGSWPHVDSIDNLIRAQLFILPFVLIIQLILLCAEWLFPILKPHEILDQQSQIIQRNHHSGDRFNPSHP